MVIFVRVILTLACCFSIGWSAVYDCFMFNNELEILEIRLNELNGYVDKFVLVESTKNHRKGTPKPCYFELNKDRFEQFRDKIIHIKLDDEIDIDNGWARENWERNQIMRGLVDCEPEDLILISDVDEFIPGNVIKGLYGASAQHSMIGFWQKMYRFFLNRDTGQVWAGTAAIRYKHLQSISPQDLRNCVRGAHMTMWHTGWHFTSMGGFEIVFEKYNNIVEGYDVPFDYEGWRAQVDAHPLVPIDGSYPKYIRENIAYLIEKELIDNPQ